jgi:molecular chaperone DnaK
MIKDAEAHADEDKARRDEADARNQAESLVYQTEKFLKENDEKVPADVKSRVEAAIAEVNESLKGTDIAAVKTAVEKLATESQAVGQAIYEATAAESAASGDGAAEDGGAHRAPEDDQVVDAEVVDEPIDLGKQ